MGSYEPEPQYSRILKIEHRNHFYKRDLRGMWHREYKSDRPDKFIGAEYNLNKEVLRILKRKVLNDQVVYG